ncbi:histamine N-methyltransferase-like isoform X3 [Limanda limanda]|uniref:histamine N-methyltransferase-like isoform X3 n=1 Tax=Limanda limanda TaxID=27771 RepID=UPI0029C712D7|nr:histamine N-methyltransferase-like isoform X3 [Limanda limanda]
MAAEAKQTCYEGSAVQSFQFYLEHSGEHEAIVQGVHSILPAQFKRIGAGKSGLDVLGVGSGGALVAKTTSLQKVQFAWHIMHSGDYEKKVKVKGDVKKFDFIHMIQMIYYVDNVDDTIKFCHSLLKNNGTLMIIVEEAHSGWDTLWKTFEKELCVDTIPESRSSAEVISSLKSQGLKYEEHIIQNTFDITECYDPNSTTGARLLSFMTQTKNVHQSLSQEVRAGILELLRNKCSTTPHLFTIPVSQVRAFCLIPPRLFLHLTHPGENEHIEVGQQTN